MEIPQYHPKITKTRNFLAVDLQRVYSPTMWIDARREKTDLKVFVVVIPKEGWVRVAVPILHLVWHRLFENIIYDVSRVKFWKVGGLFSHDAWQHREYRRACKAKHYALCENNSGLSGLNNCVNRCFLVVNFIGMRGAGIASVDSMVWKIEFYAKCVPLGNYDVMESFHLIYCILFW